MTIQTNLADNHRYLQQNSSTKFFHQWNELLQGEIEYHKYFLDSPTKDAFRFYVKKDFKDLISKLYILKLRINHEENTETIKLIDYFINFYIDILYVSDKNIEEAKENIKKLINNTQKSLDNEWEKVKKETRKI